jgi:hypothetical protein
METVIRQATTSDHQALARLAALDSRRVPSGRVLIAEIGDQLRAAVEVETGAAIADPFHPTAAVVERLHLQAVRVNRRSRGPRGRRRAALRTRAAY